MQSTKTFGQQLLTCWSRTRAAVRALVALVVLVATGAICCLPLWQKGTAQADLFETALGRNEISRIRIALTRENLNGFAFCDGHLMVPAGAQSSYLQAITDAGALPAALSCAEEVPPEVSPFMNRAQQEQVHLQHRRQQLRRLMVEMPFVADASVQLDVQPGPSAFSLPDMRCVVSVQPVDQLFLDPQQLQTIHQNVVAAIAGIQPQNIVINDRNSGLAWNLPKIQQSLAGEQLGEVDPVRARRQIEHDLQTALADWPGIEIVVNAGEPPAQVFSAAPVVPVLPRPIQRPETVPPTTVLKAGANSSARIPAELPVAPMGTAPAESACHGPAASGPAVHPATSLMNVRLNVNHEGIDHFAGKNAVATSDSRWWPTAPATRADSVALRDQLREQLLDRVTQVLERHSTGMAPVGPVAVHFCHPPIAPEKVLSAAGDWQFGNGQGTLLAVISGLALCVLVVVSMKRRRPAGGKPIAVADSSETKELDEFPKDWPDDSAAGLDRERVKEQIASLIDKNPEAAARVIQSWIRDAA